MLVLLGTAVVTAISVAVAVGGSQTSAGPPVAQDGDLLPDIDLAAPSALSVQSAVVDGKRRFRLSFTSAAENIGRGPLVIEAVRPSVGDARMVADQVVSRADGTSRRIPGVGQLEYVVDPTHDHWHLLTFMAYELRRAKGFKLARPDEKTGFCLGDRYASARWAELPEHAAAPAHLTNCGLGDRGLLGLTEGISVGFGDNYEPWRDGQWIDVTDLKAGRYVLVHRVNADRSLLEAGSGSNVSSVLISLTWPRGTKRLPRVAVLATCPDTERCAARTST
jgi:Lysyl oxidase